MEDWLTMLAASAFEILEDEDGSWYVNQYYRKDGLMVRETLAEGMSHDKARRIATGLNKMSKDAGLVLDRFAMVDA